ncbi:MAG: uroporphyrinogen-III synthase [Glaciecola sp.]|jgi:uroporphyrinogen-III synthase
MSQKKITFVSGPGVNPLGALTVLVTRPAQQQGELIQALAALGAKTLSKPMLTIEELKSEVQINQLKNKILNFAEYDIAIFVSTNAAHYGSHWIDRYWPQFPVELEVIAIGPSTAKAVTELLPCGVIQSDTGVTSEDVLNLRALQDVAGCKVAIFRGIGGRELLASALRERGATVDYFEVYTRQGCIYSEDNFTRELVSADVNVLSANSSETVDILKTNLGEQFDKFSGLILLVPSARVAEQARASGFTAVVNCEGASNKAFVAALWRLADTEATQT